MQSGSFTTLSETRDTAHSREVKKLVSTVQLPFYWLKYDPSFMNLDCVHTAAVNSTLSLTERVQGKV